VRQVDCELLYPYTAVVIGEFIGEAVRVSECWCDSDWYLAAEGVFTGAVLLLLLALVVETLYACCHCCLRRSCAPTTVASLTIAAGRSTTRSPTVD